MQAFMDHFQPASRSDSDEQMNTTEICEYLQDMLGDDIDKQKVFDFLKENGYTYTWCGDGFKWLFKVNRQNSLSF